MHALAPSLFVMKTAARAQMLEVPGAREAFLSRRSPVSVREASSIRDGRLAVRNREQENYVQLRDNRDNK